MRSSGLLQIYEMAKSDQNIIFIGSDLGFGVLQEFKDSLPQQFFMEGISEANIIGMAAGLALNSKTVYINTIASFLTRRCYEQIAINLCLENLNVKLFANGGGFIYGPMGPTHTTLEDVNIMMALPNMSVFVPCDKSQMIQLLPQINKLQGPSYIRVARDNYPSITSNFKSEIGKPLVLKEDGEFIIFSNGYFSHLALKIAKELSPSINIQVIDLHSLVPLDEQLLREKLHKAKQIISIEESFFPGGIYMVLSKLIIQNQINIPYLPITIPHSYQEKYGEQDQILCGLGLSQDHLLRKVSDFFSN